MSPELPPQEIRICLIMYGGASLAVYMNGAAREFYDLVRGRGIWGAFKRLADVDAVVDIVSGASAGGLNGLCLSYALCGEREFEPLASAWREKTGIDDLLSDPRQPKPKSLLDSRFLEQTISDALREMTPIEPGDPPELQPTRTRELDCFVAVTHFHGREVARRDARDRVLHMRSHRETVHIKHRLGRKEPFRQDATARPEQVLSVPTLAKLARATSAFPFAFEPQKLEARDLRGRIAAPRYLAHPESSESAWFVDGGVLDNKPFSEALPMIYQRHADRPVDRLLFFVEPHPAAAPDRQPAPDAPNFLETSLSSLTTLPMYESIEDELRLIDRHNQKLAIVNTLYRPLHAGLTEGPDSPVETVPPSPEQRATYDRARIHDFATRLQKHLGEDVGITLGDPLAAGEDPAVSVEQLFDCLYGAFVEGSPELRERIGVEDRDGPGFEELDVAFAKRAYYHWIYQLHARLTQESRKGRGNPELAKSIRFLARRVDMLLFLESRLARELLEAAAGAEPVALRTRPGPLRRMSLKQVLSVWMGVLRETEALAKVVDGLDEEPSGGKPDQIVDTFVKRWQERPKSAESPGLVRRFLDALDGRLEARAVEQFEAVDAWRFPALYLAGLGEKDRVEYCRVSPFDSIGVEDSLPELARWGRDPMGKLAGRHLAHFSAFLKRSWRSNDAMWGRLDAATILWDVLLEKHPMRGPVDRATLEHLQRSGIPKRRLEALAECESPRALRRALLQELQRRILEEEIPRVIHDAMHEELELRRWRWGPSAAKRLGGEKPEDYQQAARRVLASFRRSCTDPLLRRVASQAASDFVEGRGRESDEPKALDFLKHHYDVGNESVLDLDLNQSAERALRGSRVAANMLKGLMGDGSSALGGGIRFVANRATAAVTGLHLASLAVVRGWFGAVWILLVAAALAVLGIEILDPGREGTDWARIVGSALLLAGLFAVPETWFRGAPWSLWRWGALLGLVAAASAVGLSDALGESLALVRLLLPGALGLALLSWITFHAWKSVELRLENRSLRRKCEALSQQATARGGEPASAATEERSHE